MYAIIETGGKQYKVSEGDVITVEKLKAENGDGVTFDKVLIFSDGNTVEAGTPYLNMTVTGKIVESGKGEKVIVYKYKSGSFSLSNYYIVLIVEDKLQVWVPLAL